MQHFGHYIKAESLQDFGIKHANNVYWNLRTPELYKQAIKRDEAVISYRGPLVVDTGRYTGRSPTDKFIVRDSSTEEHVDWGETNQPISPDHFAVIEKEIIAHTKGKDLFVQDVFVGAHPNHRVAVRVITEYAWHSLFVHSMFVRPTNKTRKMHSPQYIILDLPSFKANPETMGTHTETVIALNIKKKLVLIGDTEYAGEIKKSAFSLMNYELPFRDVMPMHCSANAGSDDDVALFFGLSGTGKTTLSATPDRTLIGDDEHGWAESGIFNFEGGCYAKIVNLSSSAEPEIYTATRTFGTILENVVLDSETQRADLSDTSKTENTRAAYPITQITNASRTGYAGQPHEVIFLTADAFGVLPPVAKLTYEQAQYYFISGYTAKLAGTERGVTEPQATFSACFGSPFMALRPSVYADLLARKMQENEVGVWLVNTGWTGGPYGVGQRMQISYTRQIIRAILEGRLGKIDTVTDKFFGLEMPVKCPGVPDRILDPRLTWSDKEAYDTQAAKLAGMFLENFKQFEKNVSEAVLNSAPQVVAKKKTIGTPKTKETNVEEAKKA